ncbi:hypothetical protein BDW74DRAFT_178922 [Aspergillus multicolor]|uniref:uncharacterized protein n=1 Tax=Aspergillus multicolor TaxID=41759 RepID=UPI003CCDCA46
MKSLLPITSLLAMLPLGFCAGVEDPISIIVYSERDCTGRIAQYISVDAGQASGTIIDSEFGSSIKVSRALQDGEQLDLSTTPYMESWTGSSDPHSCEKFLHAFFQQHSGDLTSCMNVQPFLCFRLWVH